jgi:hypothetical protein
MLLTVLLVVVPVICRVDVEVMEVVWEPPLKVASPVPEVVLIVKVTAVFVGFAPTLAVKADELPLGTPPGPEMETEGEEGEVTWNGTLSLNGSAPSRVITSMETS